jgi:uncharacterized membrane protein YgaE (UPF0421/DUF939 family)
MDDQTRTTCLELLKLDLGITHNLRDAYFNKLLNSTQKEIERTGIIFNFLNDDDMLLVVDYAAWSYRKRQENIPLSRNLQLRINNRVIKKARIVDAVT